MTRNQAAGTRATLDKHAPEVSAMFDRVAHRYDLLNSLLTLGAVDLWRQEVLAEIGAQPGDRVLDVAAGTGSSSAPVDQQGAFVYPLDASLGMVAEGKRRHPRLDFVVGDALSLPFADHSFDAVTISFGLRNISDTHAALTELRRVTRPGGELVILEVSTPANPIMRRGHRLYLESVVPLMARMSSNRAAYDYLAESTLAWPDQQGLADKLTAAGWAAVGWRNLSGGIVALHRGWAP